MNERVTKQKTSQSSIYYQNISQLDGTHPLMNALPEGYVPYRVRELSKGSVTYFNYILAKEMGLIPSNHPHEMTTELSEALLKTFNIQIINEYDELNKRRIDPKTIKPNKYMATRYLQLQHPSKRGTTSGDGRGIWNGVVQHNNITWDVSSRGTGVTRLSPGFIEAGRPLKTGESEFGYGCGQAEIDELYAAAIMAEIMHLQGIKTERVLCVIDHGNGYGIGVRAAQNLLRPAHLFIYLKQDRLKELKAGVDYLIERQNANGEWKISTKSKYKYDDLAQHICKSFAEFSAYLDIDYIFAWLDWDGDNVLANGSIIDYGSIRQFGARHDKYRYDDVERFSTNLNEQRLKARQIVQVFVQICDYLKTGKKNPIKSYSNHAIVKKFNQYFAEFRSERLLYRMGFDHYQRQNILKNKELFEKFDKEFSYFERAKVSGAPEKVADGINHPPLFNMRNILRFLPDYFSQNPDHFEKAHMPEDLFFKTILSSFAKEHEAKISDKQKLHINNFLRLYKELVLSSSSKIPPIKTIKGLRERAHKLNSETRMTGNALIQVVDELLTQVKNGMARTEIQSVIDKLIFSYVGLPEVKVSRIYGSKLNPNPKKKIIEKLLILVSEAQDEI